MDLKDRFVEFFGGVQIPESLIKRDHVLDSLRLIGQTITASTFNTEQILSNTMEMIQSVLPVEAG